jgi:ferredoxin
MMCAAACPADGLRIPDTPFPGIIGILKEMTGRPVLGCSLEPESKAHARLTCLGALAEEHLAALAAFLPQGVQLNAEPCGNCINSFILPTLKRRIAGITSSLPGEIASRLALVENSKDLVFQEPSLDRRTFFRKLGRDLASTAADLIIPKSGQPGVQRAIKYIPLKRNLVNETARSLQGGARERFLGRFRYGLQFDRQCTLCPRCTAMCPTGALEKKREEDSERLDFSADLCTGCALCVDFCPSASVSLSCPEKRPVSGSEYMSCEEEKEDASRGHLDDNFLESTII